MHEEKTSMTLILSTDKNINDLFGKVVSDMRAAFGYSGLVAESLVHEYYFRFQDPAYCGSIGIPVQNDDFFFHEGLGMSFRVHYYLALKRNPDPHAFVEWRSSFGKVA